MVVFWVFMFLVEKLLKMYMIGVNFGCPFLVGFLEKNFFVEEGVG